MKKFYSLLQKINNWEKLKKNHLNIFGCTSSQWNLILQSYLDECKDEFLTKSQLIIFEDNEKAEEFYSNLLEKNNDLEILFYPGNDYSPYSGIYSSEKNLYERFSILNRLKNFTNNQKLILISSFEALSLKCPPKNFFKEHNFKICVEDIISPIDLANKLVNLGYSTATSVEEPGTFIQKGLIFDIFPIGKKPIRIFYFDDLIENIFLIEEDTNKTNKSFPINEIEIIPAMGIFKNSKYNITLRENIPQYGPSYKNKFEFRKKIFQKLSDGQLFENFPNYIPLFFKETNSFFEYLNLEEFVFTQVESINIQKNSLEFQEKLRVEFEDEEKNILSENILPNPSFFYDFNFFQKKTNHYGINLNFLNISLNDDFSNTINLQIENAKSYLNKQINQSLDKPEFLKETLNFIRKNFEFSGNIYFSSYSESSRNEIKHLLELQKYNNDLNSRIHFLDYKIPEGIYYEPEKLLIISDSDLFSYKKSKVSKTNKVDLDLFAEQLATLKAGDYVIHSEYGIGEYVGLESLNIAGDVTDYLILKYEDNDKIYVPVYKLNQIQKHANAEAGLKKDSLRTNKFALLKIKARTSAKALAFDLLKLQAERQNSKAFAFSSPDHLYKEFELSFPFEETEDQLSAISKVLTSMQKPVPMDFLVCGDVGFGKTEIAMRAAFKAIEDKKQVAILVPTTILALQHFNSFSKRFKDFPVRIDFISRFKSAKEAKEILLKTEKGEIDILIGTHKILSDKLKFLDLGLVIVDEEQRFGVGHKEKLKLMKASVDFLTLTATPIPRTLQMAFLGLRELSLIKTAPPKRQSIKTYVIKEDDFTIQAAILKELQRGGQVYVVHNKVQDIEEYVKYIKELAPEAKITFAHGQMSEKELEDRINDFYSGKYQILVATTIIESGIDIPNANTMIIDRADTFGLAQLHQLRGRIGRSDKKAYAYFIIPTMREISEIAQKRLHALQTYADLGSGFNLASVDLEIRGAGDILGASQAGHLEAVGLELYMELLKDAIAEIKGEQKLLKKDIEIITPFPALIPNHFIKDPGERLKCYKRLSNCESLSLLESIREELQDIYGIFNEEISNLFVILETRINLQYIGLKSLNLNGQVLILKFEKSFLDSNVKLRDEVIKFFISRPKIYQFTPDFKVIYTAKTALTQNDLLNFSKEIAKQIIP